MRRALALLMLAACAPTLDGLRREAVERLRDCANAAPVPIAMEAVCMPEVLAYCAKQKVTCEPEDLWSEARQELREDPP